MVTVRVTHGAPHNLIADSARCGRELDPRAAAANEALKPGDRLWLDDGPPCSRYDAPAPGTPGSAARPRPAPLPSPTPPR